MSNAPKPSIVGMAMHDAALAAVLAFFGTAGIVPYHWGNLIGLDWLWLLLLAVLPLFILWMIVSLFKSPLRALFGRIEGTYAEAARDPDLSVGLKHISLRGRVLFLLLSASWIVLVVSLSWFALPAIQDAYEWVQFWWFMFLVPYLMVLAPVAVVGIRFIRYAAVQADRWLSSRSNVH